MSSWATKFGRVFARRALALLACAALYFAASGALLHQHSDGSDTACALCQVLHTPALTVAPINLLSAPEVVQRSPLPSRHIALSDAFEIQRASRAPPSA